MRGNGLSSPSPLLDVPDRLGPFPRDKVLWCIAGFVLPALVIGLLRPFTDVEGWIDEHLVFVLAAWLLGVLAGVVLAFARPGGLNAAQWAAVVTDYVLRPKNTSWWR